MIGVKELLVILSMLCLANARIENDADIFEEPQLIFAHIVS